MTPCAQILALGIGEEQSLKIFEDILQTYDYKINGIRKITAGFSNITFKKKTAISYKKFNSITTNDDINTENNTDSDSNTDTDTDTYTDTDTDTNINNN